MANGQRRPISEIEVGDEVLATDPETGETGRREVIATLPHTDQLLTLQLSSGEVVTTEDHRYWNASDEQWQESQDLDEGDQLLTADGDIVTVEALDWSSVHTAPAYDLDVEGIDTYYVGAGDESVLVHNCNIGNKIAGQMADRGWTDDLIRDIRHNSDSTHAVWDLAADAPATAYARGDNYYIVVNDATGDVIQISNRNSPNWQPVWEDPTFAPR